VLRSGGKEWLAVLDNYAKQADAIALAPIRDLSARLRWEGRENGWFQNVADSCIGDDELETFYDFAIRRTWNELRAKSIETRYVPLRQLQLAAHEAFAREFSELVSLRLQSLRGSRSALDALRAPFEGIGTGFDLMFGGDRASRATEEIPRSLRDRGFPFHCWSGTIDGCIGSLLDFVGLQCHYHPHADPGTAIPPPVPELGAKRMLLRHMLAEVVLPDLLELAQAVLDVLQNAISETEKREWQAACAKHPEPTPFRQYLLEQLGDGPSPGGMAGRLLVDCFSQMQGSANGKQ
jgi:hypothetical protein